MSYSYGGWEDEFSRLTKENKFSGKPAPKKEPTSSSGLGSKPTPNRRPRDIINNDENDDSPYDSYLQKLGDEVRAATIPGAVAEGLDSYKSKSPEKRVTEEGGSTPRGDRVRAYIAQQKAYGLNAELDKYTSLANGGIPLQYSTTVSDAYSPNNNTSVFDTEYRPGGLADVGNLIKSTVKQFIKKDNVKVENADTPPETGPIDTRAFSWGLKPAIDSLKVDFGNNTFGGRLTAKPGGKYNVYFDLTPWWEKVTGR